jgi:outer membrane lipoprotein-sorting protein
MPSVPASHRTLLLVGLVLAVSLLAGCSVGNDGSDLPSGEEAAEKVNSIDAIEATIVTSIRDDTGETRTKLHTIRRLQTGEARSVTISGASKGMVSVTNGSTIWLYNRSANRVRKLEFNSSLGSRNATFESIETIFSQLNDRESSEELTPGEISQLPVVPKTGVTSGRVDSSTESLSFYGNVSVTYIGTTSVHGRETYEVHLTPTGNESVMKNTTMWFDAEWFYPIKSRSIVKFDGERQIVETTYRNVTFNPTIPEGTFEFEPPANATIVESSYESQSYDSRAEIASATEIKLPSPDLPEEYRFKSGRITVNNEIETVALEYANGSAEILITKRPVQSNSTLDDSDSGEPIDIGGQNGHAETIGDQHVISWQCGGWKYLVMGEQSQKTLLEIAKSMSCD